MNKKIKLNNGVEMSAEGRNGMFTNPSFTKIAQNHNKTVAQVVLK